MFTKAIQSPIRSKLSTSKSFSYSSTIPLLFPKSIPFIRSRFQYRQLTHYNNNHYSFQQQSQYQQKRFMGSKYDDPNYSIPGGDSNATAFTGRTSTRTQAPSPKPRDLYEKAAEDPNPHLSNTRFIRDYMEQRNMFGHETRRNDDESIKDLYKIFQKSVPEKYKKFMSTSRDFLSDLKWSRRGKQNQDWIRRQNNDKMKRWYNEIITSALTFGVITTIFYDTMDGWKMMMWLGVAIAFVFIFLPLALLISGAIMLKLRWENRKREQERAILLSKYTDEDEVQEEKSKKTPQERIARAKEVHDNQDSVWNQFLITIGLIKPKENDPDVLLGGLIKHVDIDPKTFDPKTFLAQKFPFFEWTETGTPLTKSVADIKDINKQLTAHPAFDAVKLKNDLLTIQKNELLHIKEDGVKGMLDFMIARLHLEQDELRLDRDVVMINIDRLMGLIKQNMKQYKKNVRSKRPGHVIQKFEETIDNQRIDLQALQNELEAIDERGWEIKRRLEILEQSIHNAVYSNLNGIEHPVVSDLIASDLLQVLLGHMPSDIIDQRKVFEFSSLLAPLQQQLVNGTLTIDQIHSILKQEFTYFFPEAYNFQEKLPDISQLTQSNVTRQAPYALQHVLDPLIDAGPTTQKFIEVAVDDYEEEFQTKFDEFSLHSDSEWYKNRIRERKAQLDTTKPSLFQRIKNVVKPPKPEANIETITPEEIEVEREKHRQKVQLRIARYQQLREEAVHEREDRQLRFETNKETFSPALRRQLGVFGKDNIAKVQNTSGKAAFTVPLPPPSKTSNNRNKKDDDSTLFSHDGSMVAQYDTIAKQQKEKYSFTKLLEKEQENQIKSTQEQQNQILSQARQDPRLLHQLETDRIAFGPPIVSEREREYELQKKYDEIASKIPFLQPKNYGTRDYDEKIQATINAQPSFWSGSMFQDSVESLRPVSSMTQSPIFTIAKALGFKTRDYQDDRFYNQAAYDMSILTQEDIDKAHQQTLLHSLTQQDALFQKWQGTVQSTHQSSEINSKNNIQRHHNERFSHWNQFDQDGNIPKATESIDNSYLKINASSKIEQPKTSFGPLSQKHSEDTKPFVQRVGTIISDKFFSPQTSQQQQQLQQHHPEDSWNNIFPEIEQSAKSLSKYDEKMVTQATLSSPLLELPKVTHNQNTGFWNSLFGPKEKPKTYDELLAEEHKIDVINYQQSRWSMDFKDIERLENKSQLDIITEKANKERQDKITDRVHQFVYGDKSLPTQQSIPNESPSQTSQQEQSSSRPKISIDELKQTRGISRGW